MPEYKPRRKNKSSEGSKSLKVQKLLIENEYSKKIEYDNAQFLTEEAKK